MFDYIDNTIVRTILEVASYLVTAILGFFGGISYSKKVNRIGNINNSNIESIKQENKS